MKQVLFLGAEGSGKSLLIRRIREVKEQTELSAESTVPTTGTEMKTLEIMPSCEVTLREVGASMASRW
jgi:GTPase SAR1 family protein